MLIVTHGGKFHADDAWAVAVIKVLHPEAELVRTRDQAIIDRGDVVIDVGGIWDPATGRFDHHQKGFSGARQSGVPYASAGLVWREDTAQQIAYAIDADIVQYLDLSDVGAAKNAPGGYGMSAVVSGYNLNWMDEERLGYGEAADAYRLQQFHRAMDFLTDVMANAVK